MTMREPFPLYADVILPLALTKNYTYGVPDQLLQQVAVGKRVEVSFGKRKIYAGIIARLHEQAPADYSVKALRAVLDERPLITEHQLHFWNWIADYYLCTTGEVMLAAVPAGLRLESETLLSLHPDFSGDLTGLSDDEQLLVQHIGQRNRIRLQDLQSAFPRSRLYAIINALMQKQVVVVSEQLAERFRPQVQIGYILHADFAPSVKLSALLNELEKKAPRQAEALMYFIHLSRQQKQHSDGWVERRQLLQDKRLSAAAVQALVEKQILIPEKRMLDPTGSVKQPTNGFALSPAQQACLDQLLQCLQEKTVTLLHGVTGSGKTHLYIRLMEEQLRQGHQVLYLLPEISLTAQMIARLQQSFGAEVAVYHSRLSPRERVEVWKRLLHGQCRMILGARSALFLPWQRLGLIIVDEEHDASYKQDERSPHYQGRDAAIYLAHVFSEVPCRVLLGSATPSLESYTHARSGKYGLVTLSERYGQSRLPDMVLVNIRQARKEKKMHTHFSETLLREMEQCLQQQRQVILFRNRRGYAPALECDTCGWLATCPNCDVTLTYHKVRNQLHCHYCAYRRAPYTACGACGSPRLITTGYGTQKVEEALGVFFPQAVVARLDYDTASARKGMQRIISSFEQGLIHILVGTQLVTKGLDFGRVALVGILDADQLFGFTEFRSMERGFQLMLQVSGRAGRREHTGKVILQTVRPELSIFRHVIHHDYGGFYAEEMERRKLVNFPPYCRLIQITCAHRHTEWATEAARRLAAACSALPDVSVLGPAQPYISRINNRYRMQVLIKIKNRAAALHAAKQRLRTELNNLAAHQHLRQVQVQVDVDPQ